MPKTRIKLKEPKGSSINSNQSVAPMRGSRQ